METVLQNTPETEFLNQIFKRMFDAEMDSIHTCIPATVESHNRLKKTVAVMPTVKSVFSDGTVSSKPKITNVPVQFAGSADAVIQFPLPKGTPGIIIISSSCLENWINSTGGEVEPGDSRRFDLTDAFFVPGINPPKFPGKVGTGDGLEVLYKNLKVVLGDDGILALNGKSKTFALFAALNTALQTYDTNIQIELGKIAVAINAIVPGSYTPTLPAINISAAESTTVKTDG